MHVILIHICQIYRDIDIDNKTTNTEELNQSFCFLDSTESQTLDLVSTRHKL